MTERPELATGGDSRGVDEFVRGLQAAIDASDADLFNRDFAGDVLWGSPFGAVVAGYDDIHAIHTAMFGRSRTQQETSSGAGSRYEIEHARRVADDVAVAYVRRISLTGRGDPERGDPERGDPERGDPERVDPEPGRPAAFDELALFVLVRREGSWWLAAGLHTPDRREVYA